MQASHEAPLRESTRRNPEISNVPALDGSPTITTRFVGDDETVGRLRAGNLRRRPIRQQARDRARAESENSEALPTLGRAWTPIGFQHAPGKTLSIDANQQPMSPDLRLERGADSLDHPILRRGVEIGVHRQADDFLGQLVRYRNTVVDHRETGDRPRADAAASGNRSRSGCPAPSARRQNPRARRA